MQLAAGVSLGPYVIAGPLGKGGMGEVWRARDSRLAREVAIKALPAEFASDPGRLARFEREAKVLASLNHANIASIYGVEEAAQQQFLVLELVEGETLAERLSRGALPVKTALELALQIAEAVEAAHEKDVIHRDLKPANIQVTGEGKVKVLDFGLAKAFDSVADQNVFSSPTMSLAATAQGVILGTAAYMSPEQARGQMADRRSDIWAFGCLLYEMLTGRHAFRGDTVSDILASVLAREPEYADLPATLSPRLRETLRRCLEKNAKRRWQAMGDLRVELEQIAADPAVGMANIAAPAPVNWALWGLASVAIALAAAAAAWFLKPSPPAPATPLVRFDFEVPANQANDVPLRSLGRRVMTLSPDGRHFAYNAAGGVYLRSMDTLAARIIPGTETVVSDLFFSPDGDWLGYVAIGPGELQKISIVGGAPVTLAPASQTLGASWGRDGTILFADTEGIMQVSSDGGTPKRIIETRGTGFAGSPSMLPDGKTVLYSFARSEGSSRWDQGEIIVQRPGGMPKVVVRGGSDAVYSPTGHLIYAVGTVLFAAPFDLVTLQTTGGAVPLVTGAQRAATAVSPSANFGLSTNGTLAYLNAAPTTPVTDTTLAIATRTGTTRLLPLPKAEYRNPRVSPDGRRVAVETIINGGQSVIWVYELSGNTAIRRLTQDGSNSRPIWTPDSKRILYGSTREKQQGIFIQLADGSGLPERLTTTDEGYVHYPESISPDGKVLSFARVKANFGQNSWGLWTMRLDTSTHNIAAFFDLPESNEFGSAFSPDGKWIAYASNATADGKGAPTNFAIYMQPYPPTGAKYQISETGGAWPIWASAGRELLYRLNGTGARSATLHSVSITTMPEPAFGDERTLPIEGFLPAVNNREYDVVPGGKEFVLVVPAGKPEKPAPAPLPRITTVLNWTEELKRRAPTRAQ